ncbi:mismatch repair endonuclease PMS2-like [Montipora capricornis]|uniref:mismatch repair endonuclease PMS2-like n=1 Tax=Montipora capricornis TaxID=246305 RepID=UPI0035F20031
MAAVSLSSAVQAIDKRSIHQICSGQVILSLATAMKELVENSLDAGASNVDVKLKNHGADILEVNDNGVGVEPHNFEALTLKHHTSKLQDFSDLTSVETFGFRGEALSSLCALSKLSIVTHHSSQAAATRLEYDHNGKLITKTPCARDFGTTVTLENLFSTLPVRHREFVRNIKREFTKLVHVLQGYCLISTGVRIACSNQVEKGKKTTIVSTNGSKQVKDNITCVFGPKQVQTLVTFQQYEPSDEECSELGIDLAKISAQANLFQICGYISKPDHGMGRSSADRQFLYINKRPCDLVKVSRIVNEMYHMYNRHQYPFVLLDISLARDGVDVNVTPDKRQVFVQEEKVLLAILKTSLKKMFDPGTALFDVNQRPFTQIKLRLDSFASRTSVNSCEDEEHHEQDSSCPEIKDDEEVLEVLKPCAPFASEDKFPSLSSFKRKFSSIEDKLPCKSKEPHSKQAKLTSIFTTGSNASSPKGKRLTRSDIGCPNNASNFKRVGTVANNSEKYRSDVEGIELTEVKKANKQEWGFHSDELAMKARGGVEFVKPNIDASQNGIEKNTVQNNEQSGENAPKTFTQSSKDLQSEKSRGSVTVIPKCFASRKQGQVMGVVRNRKEKKVNFSMIKLKTNIERPRKEKFQEAEARLFRAKIAPDSNSSAEKELTTNISKDMFERMEILGQFNLGFIITKLDNDLFIIDQHASDEKFNFEDQQRNVTIKSQRLIIPQRLELTAANEAILMDNVEIFQMNGFEFEIDQSAQAMNKIKLVSLPMSKNWTFGVEDIEELIFMLSDSPGMICRPSRVGKMFASRACRMSVMVGTALNQTQMKRIVSHMGKIEHPWNCPHGRPTMRHLINLGMLHHADQD